MEIRFTYLNDVISECTKTKVIEEGEEEEKEEEDEEEKGDEEE